MTDSPHPSTQPLLAAAITAFGKRGLDGASTRDIAREAGRPMSAITYHFGGKDGLYLACAGHIAGVIGGLLAPALAALEDGEGDADRAATRRRLHRVFANLVSAMTGTETALFARFVIREQMEPTPAFDVLYGGIMGKVANQVAEALVTFGGGRVSLAEARIRTIALIGQVLAFRVARAAALRLNGWADIGPDEAGQIAAVIAAQLDAILDALAQDSLP